jgi:hypothetical protein
MVCSHCKCSGHNFKGCPDLTQEEKEKKIKENKEKKNNAIERRLQVQERYERATIAARKKKEEAEKQMKSYEIVNQTQHELAIYWAPDDNPLFFTHFSYIPGNTTKGIRCNKDKHQLCIFHSLEVTNPTLAPQTLRTIVMDGSTTFDPVFKMKMSDFDGNIIVVDKAFVPKKTELEQWKESSLKANFLLEQIIKMGGKTYENIEPMLDMVEDIKVPDHTEYDREIAGVPSKLTNIT